MGPLEDRPRCAAVHHVSAQVLLCAGMLTAALVDWGLSSLPGAWRWMVAMPLAPALLMSGAQPASTAYITRWPAASSMHVEEQRGAVCDMPNIPLQCSGAVPAAGVAALAGRQRPPGRGAVRHPTHPHRQHPAQWCLVAGPCTPTSPLCQNLPTTCVLGRVCWVSLHMPVDQNS
jgi:hypothetical protein